MILWFQEIVLPNFLDVVTIQELDNSAFGQPANGMAEGHENW